MKIDLHFNINLTPKQKEVRTLFYDKTVKEIVLNFARQTGKTTLCEILAIETLVSKACNVAYISPDFAQGKKVYREMVNLLEQTGLIAKKNSSELIIELINGSYMQFFSAKNPTAIRGNTISGLLIIDEAAYVPEETSEGQNFYYMIVKPITKAKHPKIIFTSTPNGKQGFYYEKFLEGLESETVRTVECTIYDDTTIDEKGIQELKRTTPPLAFQQEFECKFLDSALTVFDGYENRFKKYAKTDFTDGVWIGVDLSGNGKDDTILCKISKKGYVEEHLIEGTLDAKYRKIADIINGSKNLIMCYCEANGIGEPMVNEVRKLVKNRSKVLYFTTTSENKNEMVGDMQLAISEGSVTFNEDDVELYKQMGVFTYKVNRQTRRVSYAAKEPYHDDRVMALLLAKRAKQDYPVATVSSSYSFIQSRRDRI